MLLTKMSQSVAFGTSSAWFPVVASLNVPSEIAGPFQSYTQGIVHVVANLTTPQTQLFFAQNSPNVFCPHVGLFVSEFAVGTALIKGK